MASHRQIWNIVLAMLMISSVLLEVANGVEKKKDSGVGKTKKKKDIRDFNDADMERLFQEWEDAEEEKDPDDLPEHMRPSPSFDMSQLDLSDPENAMKITKKGKTLMIFVSVSGDPTQDETDTITTRWESMLFNAQYSFKRYPVSSDRVIFLLTDGSLAWEIKDFLIKQDRCKEVSIESHVFHGKGSGKKVDGKGNLIEKDEAPITKKKHTKEEQDKQFNLLKDIVDDPDQAEIFQKSFDMFGEGPPEDEDEDEDEDGQIDEDKGKDEL